MKIGIEGQRLFRKRKFGMDIVALEMIRHLQKIDAVNEYVIFVKPDEDKDCIPTAPNFKVVTINASPYPVWEQFALARAARKEGCDLLHCTSNTAPVRCKIPLVTTLHDVIFMENNDLMNTSATAYQKFGNLYRKWVAPYVAQNSARLITVSNYSKSEILRFFPVAKKLDVVYNGVNQNFHLIQDEALKDQVRKDYNLPPHFCLFMGNSDPRKNAVNVLKAFSMFQKKNGTDYKLVITNIPLPTLKTILETNGTPELIDHILVTSYLPFATLPVLVSLSEVFLYPSLSEGFGIPVIEAMACGVPVVTSDRTSLPEVAGNAAAIVDPNKPNEIAIAIENILTNTEYRERLIREGIERAKLFSWENTAHQVLDIYKKVLDQ